MSKPNIFLLCLDALRADHFTDPQLPLPNLHRLLQNSTFFADAVAASTTTSPSVASVLTGAYPFRHGIQSLVGYKLHPDIPTLPQILQNHGYHTCALVTGPLSENLGLNRGFTHYLYRERQNNLHTPWKNQLLDTLRQMPQPWMLFLHLWELHLPRTVPPQFEPRSYGKNNYQKALAALDFQLGEILNLLPLDRTLIVVFSDHGESIKADLLKKALVELSKYHRLAPLARHTGKFLDRLRQYLPFGPHDHYAPGFRRKFEGHGYHVYDYLVKIPLLFAGADLFPPRLTITRQVSQVDIMPTLLDALHLPHTSSSTPQQGRSLLPLIQNPDQTPWEELAFVQAAGITLQNQNQWIIGLRTPPWKFARGFLPQSPRRELYHLGNDPYECRNLAARHPDLIQKFDHLITQTLSQQSVSPMSTEEENLLADRLKDLGYL